MSTETLLPTTDESSSGTIAYSSGGSAAALINTDNGDTSYIDFQSNGYIAVNIGDMTAIPATINSVTITASARYVASTGLLDEEGAIFVKIGTTRYLAGWEALDVSAFPCEYTATWTLNPETGDPWTAPELNELIIGFEVQNHENDIRLSYLEAIVDFYGLQATLEATRYIASLELFHNRKPHSIGTFVGTMDLLDVPLGGRVSLEHIAGPHATGEGWESKKWQREPFIVHSHTIDLNKMTVTTDLLHERPFLATVWFPAFSDKASGSIEDGIPRFSVPGSEFRFERASSGSFTNPVGEVEVSPPDVPCYADGGLQILAASGGRADDIADFYFDEDSILVPASNWTMQAEVKLATVTGAYQTVYYLEYDVNNAFSIHYNGGAGQWQFNIVIGGVLYAATKTTTPSAGTWYQIGARMTGPEGENDVPPYTISIYVQRVKGTDGVASGHLVIPATGTWNLKIGRSDVFGGGFLDGQIRKMQVTQYAFSDIEMERPI